MKKTSAIVKEKHAYEIDILINNTAYIKSVTGKSGLLNIETNEIIGHMDNYYTIYDTSDKFYYQTKELRETTSDDGLTSKKTVIRIYDALNEKMIADDWEVIRTFRRGYEIASLKSPMDGKVHLYDEYACRQAENIFDMPLDDVELLYSAYNDTYFVVTMNGKKGLYHSNCYNQVSSFVMPIEFDDIEKLPNMIVYTKGNEKYLVATEGEKKTIGIFDSVSVDEKDSNIAYCKKELTTYVYNTYSQKLLLETDFERIQFIKKNGDSYNEFFFITQQDGKFGLVSSKIDEKARKSINSETKVTTLLQPNYDEIIYRGETFYLKKDKKMGIFLGNSGHHQFIDTKYDRIDYLGDYNYALYTGKYCDIGKVTPYTPYQQIISKCQIEKELSDGFIYKKGNLFGLSLHDGKTIISAKYKNITCVADHYFLVEQYGRKGMMHFEDTIIPVIYDDIAMGGSYSKYGHLSSADVIYFALKMRKEKYKLAKSENLQYANCDVEFVSERTFKKIVLFKDIMALTDKSHLYICDYHEQLLKVFPSNSSITAVAKSVETEYKDYLYAIDGVYYYYQDGKFAEVFVEENDFHITTYETDTDLFEVKTLDSKEHDAFCSFIDIQEEKDAERALIEMAENTENMKEKFPTLVLRRTYKKQV